jgi:hypothetical protein
MERLGATQIPPWALRVHSKRQLTAEPLRGTIDPLRPLEQLRQCGSHGMEPIDRAAADGPARAAGIAASTLERCPAKACPGLDPGACPGLDPGACPGLDPGWIPVRVKAPRCNCHALRCSIIGRHTPRTRSIRYAAAFRFHHRRPGIPDRPVEPDDDSTSIRILAARCARVVARNPFARQRAWGMPGARCTRSRVREV